MKLILWACVLYCAFSSTFAFVLPCQKSSIQTTRGIHIDVSTVRHSKSLPVLYSQSQEDGSENIQENEFFEEEAMSDEITAKLKAELATPFRRLRLLLYGAAGVGGFISAWTSIPSILASLSKVEGSQPIAESGFNVAIDIAVIIAAVAAFYYETKDQRQLEEAYLVRQTRMSNRLSKTNRKEKEYTLSTLPLDVAVDTDQSRFASVGELMAKANQNFVVLAGSASFIADALRDASLYNPQTDFNQKDVMVVPVLLKGNLGGLRSTAGGGGGFEARPLFLDLSYVSLPMEVERWLAYIRAEVDEAEAQGNQKIVKTGIVIVAGRDGKIMRRGLGLPKWEFIFDEITNRKLGALGEQMAASAKQKAIPIVQQEVAPLTPVGAAEGRSTASNSKKQSKKGKKGKKSK